MRKHLLPLFFLVLGLLIIIPHNVYAPTSISFKSFCNGNVQSGTTGNCTLTGVSTGDSIIANVFGSGAFGGFTTTDGQSNTYSLKISSITGSGSGKSTLIFTTLSTTSGGSLVVTIATGGPVRSYGFTVSDYSGVTGFGKSGADQNDNTGNGATSTITLT